MSPQSEKIVALAKKNVRPSDIARSLGIKVDSVYSTIRHARTLGVSIPLFSSGAPKPKPAAAPETTQKHISVPMRLFGLLEAEAARRGRTPSETAQLLLEGALLRSWDQGAGASHD